MPRDIDLTFDIATGELTFDRLIGNYVKRMEAITMSVTVLSDGAAHTALTGATLTIKPVNVYDNVLAAWTLAQVGSTNVLTGSQTLNSAAITTLLGTTIEKWNCVLDIATAANLESETLAIVLQNNVTRSTDGTPTPTAASITASGYTMNTGRILVRWSAGSGAIQEGTIGNGLSLSGSGVLSATGGGTVTSVAATVPGGFAIGGSPITGAGTLAITANGTSGGVLYYPNATTMASSGVLAANALMVGGGAGAPPSTVTTAAGILTFLATPSSANLRAAITDESGTGALLFADGALGTPESGVATNLTGTATGLTAGTATTALSLLDDSNTLIGNTDTWVANAPLLAPTLIAAPAGYDYLFRAGTGVAGNFFGFDTTTGYFYGNGINGNTVTTGTGTLTLGAFTLTAAGNASVSGTNTGDQTSVSGNAATATAFQNSRTIGGSSFDGTANVTSFPSPGAIGGTTPSTIAFTSGTGDSLVLKNQLGDGQTVTLKNLTGPSQANRTMYISPSVDGASLGLSGDFGTTGGSLTFNLGGATSLTLPASGTLATLAGSEALTNKTLTSPSITTSIVTGSTTLAVFNTTATTVNAFGAATNINLGTANVTGTTTTSGIYVGANSLTTGTGLYISSSTLTTGKLIDLAMTGNGPTSGSPSLLNIALTGANTTNAITTTGATISNTRTNATSGTNKALTLTASGATTANTALEVMAGNITVPAGAVGAPTIQFPSVGLYSVSTTLFTGAGGVATVALGASGTSVVVKAAGYFGWTAGTSADAAQDTSIGRDAPLTVRIYNNLVLPGYLQFVPQALSGAGAVNLTTSATDFTSTGASQALTLANGAVGQIKTITHIVDGGSGILTPTTASGYTTITFTNAGDSVTLRYCTTAGWCVIGSFGVTIA